MKNSFFDLGEFVGNNRTRKLLLEYLTVIGLEEIPYEENENLVNIMETNDIDALMALLIQYVPDLGQRIDYFISENRVNHG